MNPEYTEYRFPIIKPESWEKVFKGRGMPKEFMDLIDKMLMFAPDKRTKPIYLLGHPFFDELRNQNTKLENGKDLPELFNFNKVELGIDSKYIKEHLIPDWYIGNSNNDNYYLYYDEEYIKCETFKKLAILTNNSKAIRLILLDDCLTDMFLRKYFSAVKYNVLRETVKNFAEGYDLADINKASVFALRDEWMEEQEAQYRIAGGYRKLTDHLLNKCTVQNCDVYFSAVVHEIHWQQEHAELFTKEGRIFII
jgi:hypothetical protein